MTYLTTLTSSRAYFRERPLMAFWRIFFMGVTLLLLVIALVPTGSIDDDDGVPLECCCRFLPLSSLAGETSAASGVARFPFTLHSSNPPPGDLRKYTTYNRESPAATGIPKLLPHALGNRIRPPRTEPNSRVPRFGYEVLLCLKRWVRSIWPHALGQITLATKN